MPRKKQNPSIKIYPTGKAPKRKRRPRKQPVILNKNYVKIQHSILKNIKPSTQQQNDGVLMGVY